MVVFGYTSIRIGSARRIRFGLRANGDVRYRDVKHPRRHSVPENSSERGVLIRLVARICLLIIVSGFRLLDFLML